MGYYVGAGQIYGVAHPRAGALEFTATASSAKWVSSMNNFFSLVEVTRND